MAKVMLAKKYDGFDPTGWWMSEKYDGVRAGWDGENFVSRNGKIFSVPDELKAEMPDCHLDGEFWIGRGMFQKTVGIVRRKTAKLEDWRNIKYVVFEAPNHPGTFERRHECIKALNLPAWVIKIDHIKCTGRTHFDESVDDLLNVGAEGIMLSRPNSLYDKKRSENLYKDVPVYRDEATVIGYKPGSGKYANMVGSLICRTVSAVTFALGGLSATEKESPPQIGALVTYAYKGLTNAGRPRQPAFIAVRNYE